MKTVDQLITEILNREGPKYVNHPNDKGGPTKFGITIETLHGYRKRPTSTFDVQNLTEAEAKDIYLHNYVISPGYSQLEDGILIEQLIDAGVNHGVGTAIRMLQRSLGVDTDGSIGPDTIAAYKKRDPKNVVLKFLAYRARYYGDILDSHKHVNARQQWVFAAGWFNRLGEMIEKAQS